MQNCGTAGQPPPRLQYEPWRRLAAAVGPVNRVPIGLPGMTDGHNLEGGNSKDPT